MPRVTLIHQASTMKHDVLNWMFTILCNWYDEDNYYTCIDDLCSDDSPLYYYNETWCIKLNAMLTTILDWYDEDNYYTFIDQFEIQVIVNC